MPLRTACSSPAGCPAIHAAGTPHIPLITWVNRCGDDRVDDHHGGGGPERRAQPGDGAGLPLAGPLQGQAVGLQAQPAVVPSA